MRPASDAPSVHRNVRRRRGARRRVAYHCGAVRAQAVGVGGGACSACDATLSCKVRSPGAGVWNRSLVLQSVAVWIYSLEPQTGVIANFQVARVLGGRDTNATFFRDSRGANGPATQLERQGWPSRRGARGTRRSRNSRGADVSVSREQCTWVM